MPQILCPMLPRGSGVISVAGVQVGRSAQKQPAPLHGDAPSTGVEPSNAGAERAPSRGGAPSRGAASGRVDVESRPLSTGLEASIATEPSFLGTLASATLPTHRAAAHPAVGELEQ